MSELSPELKLAAYFLGRRIAGQRKPVAYLYRVSPVSEEVPIGDITLGYTTVDPASEAFNPYTDVVRGTNLMDYIDIGSLRAEPIGWNRYHNRYTPAEGYDNVEFMLGFYHSDNVPLVDNVQLIFRHTVSGEETGVTDTHVYFSESDISPFGLYIVAYWRSNRPVSYFLLALPQDETLYIAGRCLGKPQTEIFPFLGERLVTYGT